MFWKARNQTWPGNIFWNSTGANQVVGFNFQQLVKIYSIYVRSVPSGASLYIYGAEYGNRQFSNEVNFIYGNGVQQIVGAPNISGCQNALELDTSSNNNLIHFQTGWLTRVIYMQGTLTGGYRVNFVYGL